MANSKYEYVREFEENPTLLPNTFIVVRVDGRGFHKFANKHGFQKPNDRRALDLMNAAAEATMREISDISIAYGVSDEYSFVFDRATSLFDRRTSKILTTVVSTFTSYYVYHWPTFFSGEDQGLSPPLPSFDGRVVLYPSTKNIRDYLSWRQVDCHINNLYNTTFWTLVERGKLSNREAEERLKGTVSADKNEILFSQFGINYNNEPELFKKGSVLYRVVSESFPIHLIQRPDTISKTQAEKQRKLRQKATIQKEHVDIIQDAFWEANPYLLLDS
ncbi:MAG: tRNA-His guanylyltransferase [Ramalina farinacea]|uniref:tRNA(His) guanylyltransferase n=1 Tax=Ramalina farinacea TaxID=258253 RepID=A0AA43TW92_9LECA|nr:tRNA-His guanylyltransferase [Ramalina farinacea]